MKVTTQRGLLLDDLQLACGVIEHGSAQEILRCALLVAEDDALGIGGTDLRITVKSSHGARIHSPGMIAVPAKILLDAIRSAPEGDVTLTLDQALRLQIVAGSATYSISCLSAKSYPSLPSPSGKPIEIPAQVLRDALKETTYAANEIGGYGGVLLVQRGRKDGAELVGFDGMASLALVPFPLDDTGSASIFLPLKLVNSWLKHGEDEEAESVVRLFSDNHVTIQHGYRDFSCVLKSVSYPDYRSGIPASSNVSVLLDRSRALQALGRVLPFIGNLGPVQITLSRGQIQFATKDITDAAADHFPVEYSGKDIDLLISGHRLALALKAIRSDGVRMSTDGALSPMVLRPDDDNTESLHMIAPMRPSRKEPRMNVKYVEAMVPDRKSDAALVPLSSIDSIRRQMEREGYLCGDEVAIVLLDDLKALIDNQPSARVKV